MQYASYMRDVFYIKRGDIAMKKRLLTLTIALIAIVSSSLAAYAGPHTFPPPPLCPPGPLSAPIHICDYVPYEDELYECEP